MAKATTYYIGQRVNPQLKKSYYVAYGTLSKKDARSKENCSYGSMYLTDYPDKEAYEKQIEKLRSEGFTVNIR
jgi:hypothetical protein